MYFRSYIDGEPHKIASVIEQRDDFTVAE